MSWALSEIRSLSVKATRGAGLSWGYAEEAGFAVEWLETRALPGAEALARYLDNVTSGQSHDAANCPIATGALISDTGNRDSSFPCSIHQPLLLVPFLASIAGQDSFELSWNKQQIVLNATGITGGISNQVTSDGLFECALRSDVVSTLTIDFFPRVGENRKPSVEALGRHAQKTYAPSTEASRTKGAGAGLNDND